MKTQTTNQGFEVQEGLTKIIVPHKNTKITFVHPCVGPNTYTNIANQLTHQNLKHPTASQTSSLVYSALQNPKGLYEKQVIQVLKDSWMWMFTGNLYVPNEGVYIQDNPSIETGKVFMDKKDLVKKLEQNNPSVRFVPFGFKIGEQSSLDLAKNSYIKGLAGEEGAEKIAKASENYSSSPYLWSFDSVDEEKLRVSALYEVDGRLLVDGYFGDLIRGHAFGVLE